MTDQRTSNFKRINTDKADKAAAGGDKDIIYAAGIVKHFQKDTLPYTLYFCGSNSETGEEIKRKIKLSKKVRAYSSSDCSRILPESEYPQRDEIYKANVMIESWSWEGNSCMRILAFELGRYIGKNEQYTNPFHDSKRAAKDDASSESSAAINKK